MQKLNLKNPVPKSVVLAKLTGILITRLRLDLQQKNSRRPKFFEF
jgi:hypothetical protein